VRSGRQKLKFPKVFKSAGKNNKQLKKNGKDYNDSHLKLPLLPVFVAW